MTKYITIALAFLLSISVSAFLWQRNTIVQQKDEISNLSAIVTAAEEGKEANKKLAKEKQQLADSNYILRKRISSMGESNCIGEEDEEILNAVTDFFNNHGVLSEYSETNKTLLPSTGETNSDKASWTIKLFIENYNTIIKYSLDWEKTGKCYAD